MENPNILTKIAHSQTKSAWNVIGIYPAGCKYKVARVPYEICDDERIAENNRTEAFKHATFISECFNKSDFICDLFKTNPRFLNPS